MKAPRPIQLTIPEPCGQDWNKMTPCAQGKFCGQCSKEVIDFSSWSDAALYRFFAEGPEHVCGRFSQAQLRRDLRIPYQPHSRLYRMVIAWGLVLTFTSAAELNAQTSEPKARIETGPRMYPPGKPKNDDAATIIQGTIYNGRAQVVEGINVAIYQNGKMVASSTTDADGIYSMELKEGGAYEIRIERLFRKRADPIHILSQTTTKHNLYLNPRRFSGWRRIMGCPRF
ncbi:MAG: carboxypeptidase regulatory-like domain-containing protein [Flavipsychrobacter sp.]|nr:carboxypeptidase regulatory-like domain-containing protein [Flavipsychrobacter sp.]